jgi:hypothetical protein
MGTTKPEEKKGDEGPKRPTFFKSVKSQEPETGLTRGAFGGAAPKKEETPVTAPKEEKKEPAGPWRSNAPQSKPAESSSGGFAGRSALAPSKTAPVSDKKNEKGDDSWSFSGGAGRKNGAPAKK